MERGKHVIFSVILVYLLAIISGYSYAQDIYVQPSETDTSMGEFSNVDIMVRDVTGLSTFEFRFLFDKDILEGVRLAKGSLWNDPDYLWHAGVIDNTSGSVGFTLGAASSGSEPFGINVGSNGGMLATITFQAIAKGTSTIGLTDVIICDVDGNEISVHAIDGTVNSVNRQPVADGQSVTTNEDTPVGITLTGSDPDGDPLTYAVISDPSNGSLSGTAPNMTYTPNAGFSGNDSFTFKVNDDTVDSNIATVSITVEPIEDVSTMVQVNTTIPDYDEGGSQLSMLATWTNIGSSQLSEPLRMVVENFKPSSVSVVNADGTTPGGKPYYDYSNSVDDGRLDPGETSEARQIILSGPGGILRRMKFTLDLSCWAHIDIGGSIVDSRIASATIAVNPIEAPGWSLISFPVQPSDTEPTPLLSSIDGKYDSVWAYDPDMGWSTYAPGAPSDLQKMKPGEGYWIKMQKQGTLMVQGNEPDQTRILLKGGGWNLVGYSSQKHRSTEECMSQVADAIDSVWKYDPETGWSTYTPGGLSDLGVMGPGYGYWIEANRDCIWDVNAIAPAATPPLTAKSRSSYVPTKTPGMPYRIWGDVEIDGAKAMEADNPIVILKVNDRVYSSYTLGTVESYGDSYVLDIPADITDSAQAEILVQVGDKVIESGPIPPGGPGQVLRFDLTIRFSPKASKLYQNYPNPFNPETWIPYELLEASNVRIEIYSLSGQLVRKLDLGYRQPGFYKRREDAAYWDGTNEKGEKVASGIYFYTIKADSFSTTRKMTVLR